MVDGMPNLSRHTNQPLTSTPTHAPQYSNQDIVGLNQKLDRMVTIMMDQKSIIERGKLLGYFICVGLN